MNPPKVYIDTNVLKFSATRLPRLRPRKQTITWGGQVQEITVHDFILLNPNDFIDNPELKAEAELLPLLARAGKQGRLKYAIQVETVFESWGIPQMDSQTGKFYGAPCERVDAPMHYSRVLLGFGKHGRDMQFEFLSSLRHKRFLELQKTTGAYQGKGKLSRNQVLDAFHIWCAEHNRCDYFLTLDFKLIRMIRNNKNRQPMVEVVRPSELIERVHICN